ncbi:MAG: 4-oxalocrotonate tautomerase [Chthonomonadales bacterium]|nr:4-oxalocrotonate tautomerase [Chthonomonadales bacterium]
MPLVRIDMRRGRPEGFGRKVGEIVYRTMMETIHVPVHDNFQVITEHDADGLVYDPQYLDISRSEGIIMVQITLNIGRTLEMKKALYSLLAERLHQELGVRPEDLFVNLVEVSKENWSFGNGIAQYASS